jgi:hypothetical protein
MQVTGICAVRISACHYLRWAGRRFRASRRRPPGRCLRTCQSDADAPRTIGAAYRCPSAPSAEVHGRIGTAAADQAKVFQTDAPATTPVSAEQATAGPRASTLRAWDDFASAQRRPETVPPNFVSKNVRMVRHPWVAEVASAIIAARGNTRGPSTGLKRPSNSLLRAYFHTLRSMDVTAFRWMDNR